MGAHARRRPRSRSRSWRHLSVGAALVAGALLVPSSASATHYQASLEGSNFEIDNDANFVNNTAGLLDDWVDVAEARQEDAATGQNDDSYSGGVKEDTVCPGETTGSIPNNKSDLRYFGVYEEEGDPGFLHLFWTRVSDPSGTTLMDFEFNQSTTACADGPNVQRTAGDILLEYSIDQGGARANITIRRWTGSAWGPATMLAGADATGTINTSPISAGNSDGTLSSGQLAARTFGEASIDLDVIFDEDKCQSFGSAMLKSRSSDSFTSQLKDFISPVPITLTNCGKVVVRKQTDPEQEPNTTEFDFSKSFNTDPATGNTFSLTDDGVQTFTNVLFGTGYTVEELLGDDLPDGWDLVDVDCSAGNVTPTSVEGATVTFDIDDEDDVLDCTYTNQARGNILVDKVTVPAGSSQSFDFTADYDADGFSLTDADAPNDSGPLVPGTYSVAETVPDGWDLTSATCSDGSAPASVSLQAGETVTCTFTNTQRGTIVVDKVTDPAGSTQEFEFDPSWDDNFLLTDAADPYVSGPLQPGPYNVTETVPDGWDNTAATCSNGDDPASITLDPAETVTCTFTNVQRGQIIVVKETDPASADLFDFSTSYGPDFQLSDGQSNTSELLVPGTYSVSETEPEGWDLSASSCDDGSPVDAIELGAGEIVTCTFTNTQRGKIVVVKQTDPDGSTQSFDFTASYDADGFSLADGESNDSGFLLPNQTYSVSETVPEGWDLTDATCGGDDDGTDPASIQLDPGEVVTCTFTNTQRGTIVVVKQTDPDGSTQSFDFTASYDADGFSLTDGQSNDSGFLVPGSYTVAESEPTGWDLTSAVCDDDSAPSDISLEPGETVTCTFTNTQRGTITVVKQTDPDGSTQLFDFTSSYGDPFQLADGQSDTSGPLEPGTYSVSETVPAGWDLMSATCSDGSSPAGIELASGESVTCTFENRQRGAITIEKTDDAGAVMEGVTFTLYADLFPFGGSPGQEDIDPGAVGSCVTDANGTCTVGDLVPDVSYWVVETPIDGHVEPDPVVQLVEPGQTVTVERVNVREFQIITYVCKTADQSLYASTVDDAGNVVQTLTDVPAALAAKGVTAAELCGLAANLGGKTAGSHPLTVDIPVNPVP